MLTNVANWYGQHILRQSGMVFTHVWDKDVDHVRNGILGYCLLNTAQYKLKLFPRHKKNSMHYFYYTYSMQQ